MYVSGVPDCVCVPVCLRVCVPVPCLPGLPGLADLDGTDSENAGRVRMDVARAQPSCCSIHATFQQADHAAQYGHLLVEQLAGIEEVTMFDDFSVSELEA